MSDKLSPARLGFTLIELLMVVAIIGILSSIAVPQYNKYRQRAQDAVVVAAIDQIISAQQFFFLDNDRFATTYHSLALISMTKDSKVNYGAITLVNNGADFSFQISHKTPGSTLFTYDSSNTNKKFTTSIAAGLTASVW